MAGPLAMPTPQGEAGQRVVVLLGQLVEAAADGQRRAGGPFDLVVGARGQPLKPIAASPGSRRSPPSWSQIARW